MSVDDFVEYLLPNLLFAIYIKNNEMRGDKIRQVYRWFCDKMEKWNSLDKIKYRTDKNIDEKESELLQYFIK